MKKLIVLFLFSFSLCSAQIPTDFKNVYDSISFISDPAIGTTAKQITGLTRTLPVAVQMPKGYFKIGMYTNKNAGPIEKYVQFSGFMKDSVDTSNNPTINITVIASSYLAIISKASMSGPYLNKVPLMRLYNGTTQVSQTQFFTSGNYYYVYLRRTALSQIFKIDFDGSGDSNKMLVIEPQAGKSAMFVPYSQTVTINVTDPFR